MSLATSPPPIDRIEAEPVEMLHARDNGLLLSTEEFDAIDDAEEGYRYELIRGVVVVSPATDSPERRISEELGYLIRTYKDHHPMGRCVHETLPEHDIRIGPDRRRADRVVWLETEGRFSARTTPPSIVIEIVSPGSRNRRRDFVEKRDAYLSLEILEYWVLDRVRRTMTVFAKRAGAVVERNLTASEIFATGLMPGFELRLGPLFAVVDRLEP